MAGALQTEFPFTLPKGYVDRQGTLHRKGMMRLATARDEILPLQDPRVRTNQAYLVIILLARVITKLGSIAEQDINTGLIEELFSADLSYLQDLYRRINGGQTLLKVACPSCQTQFDVDLSVGE